MQGAAVSPTGPTYFYAKLESRSFEEPSIGGTIKFMVAPAFVTEVLGAFCKVLTVAMTAGLGDTSINVTGHSQTWDPMAVGSILMVVVYMGCHVSGAHYNPAVSLGVWLRGKISLGRMFWYWLAQLLGATLGAILAYVISGYTAAPGPGIGFTAGEAFFAELIYTTLLVCVVLAVSTTKSTDNNSFFGLAQGFCYLSAAYSIGPISGAVINPAAATGMLLTRTFIGGSFANIWLYWLAPCLGAVFAVLFYRLMNPQEYEVADVPAAAPME